MMKRLIVLLALVGLILQSNGCGSKDTQAESPDAADVASSDLEPVEEGAIDDAESAAAAESLGEGEVANAEEPKTDNPEQAEQTPEQQLAEAEALPPDPLAENGAQDIKPSDATAAQTAATEPPPPVAEQPKEVANASTTIVDSEPPAVKAPSAPLQKVATVPWKVGKTLFNAVYFARPGDNLLKISKMIYGTDKRKELKKGNVAFQSRDVRPGDKVYYNSPNRPDDASRINTYYEDNGLAPEVYVAKAGDNIRKVSKKLLGYDGAWKEVWSSNALESKAEIPEGTELRYWSAGMVAAAPVAPPPAVEPPRKSQKKSETVAKANPPPPPAEVAKSEPPPPPPSPEMVPPPPPPEQAQAAIPPPPPMPEQQAAADIPPPPPPDTVAGEQPPPPPPVEGADKTAQAAAPEEEGEEEEEESAGVGDDTTMALAVLGIAALGLAALIVLKKKRKNKDLESQALDTTQLGS